MGPIADTEDKLKYPAHWLEGIVKEIEERNPSEVNLSTGKTPSGHIHLGIMRELLICDALYRIFSEKGISTNFRLFFDSLDAAKRFPSYIPETYAKKYIGRPFVLIPNPFDQNDKMNYAEVFGKELESTFREMGIHAEIVWSHDLYKTEEMLGKIRIGLQKNEHVKKIVAKYLTASMTDEQKEKYLDQQKAWMGAMVICENCQSTQKKQKDGTVSPNRVLEYNSQTDECKYLCPSCGYEGEVKIDSGLLKLNWRLDWPAKWTQYQTTCEPAGKDHCTPGGSYDTGLDLCQNIYDYEGPIKVSYEWLRLGDRDMKTSKGIVFTPTKFLEMADAKILRMLIYQTNPNKHISIRIEELEQYYNEFHRIEKIYYELEKPSSEQELKEIKYIYPLIYPNEVPEKLLYQIPFKFMTILAQLKPILKEQGIIDKALNYIQLEYNTSALNIEDFKIQIEKASKWIKEMKSMIASEKNPQILKKIKQKVSLFSIVDKLDETIISQLSDDQIEALEAFLQEMKKIEELDEEIVKDLMVNIRNSLNIKPMKIFQAFYLIFLGNKKGPRLGSLMSILDKNWIETRIELVLLSKK